MTDTRSGSEFLAQPDTTETRRSGWLAAGGLTGAVLASSCCIVPLLLATLGVSGAWIGNLTTLEPYRPWFSGAALLLIGLGFRHAYFRPGAPCADGSHCARPRSALVTKSALWIATVLVILALTVGWWAPFLY